MKRNIYEKPEITVLSVSMESVMVNVSGEVDGVVKIPDGGDAEEGMEAQSKAYDSFDLWEE